ncbi:hypothetical protein [Oceanobacillus chungangensis]|uniref:Uncharacterized protein n=1 Tax=Oceanobacillus chungangensis TaxID=1229152 RepID=A0A3D8Q023_9BACI|nr:hypothetical protein [Oceanobacillus chungangensis]RDW20769.1 hypothetical protein CWR45_05970 [Oceanobacillus chungangensis]
MQLKYKNEYFQIDNNESAINIIIERVNQIVEDQAVVFSHLLIDDIEVYENHEEYIKKHLNEIALVEIITRSVKETIWEAMKSINSYLQRSIPALTELVDEGYEGFFSRKSWEGLAQLTEGMQWILKFMIIAERAPQKPAKWDEMVKGLKQCETSFTQLLEASEVMDTVLISDILSYEVTPAYETLRDALVLSLKNEEYLKNVN